MHPDLESSSGLEHAVHFGAAKSGLAHVLQSVGASSGLAHVLQPDLGSSNGLGHLRMHLCLYVLLMMPGVSVQYSVEFDSQPAGQLLLVLLVVCFDKQQSPLSLGSKHS